MARSQSSRPSARDRILAAASDLFYKEGVQNVGIDRIIAASGVAKMSLYNHFKSKDALIAAWLQERDAYWREWFQETVERLVPPSPEVPEALIARQRLLAMFDALQEWFDQADFRGCAFINSAVELVDQAHPGYQVTLAHQQAISDYVLDLVKIAGLAHPQDLTQQLLLLVEGAIVVAMMQSTSTTAMQAKAAAAILIQQAQAIAPPTNSSPGPIAPDLF